MTLPDDDILHRAETWLAAGHGVALATVVETWGSAPRPVGSPLVVRDDGVFFGSVSGGCVEGDVIGEAVDIIGRGGAKLLSFGVADETAWRSGLSCGGRISVYVEKLDAERAENLRRLNAARAARRAMIVVTDLLHSTQRLVGEADFAADPLAGPLLTAWRTGRSGMVEGTQEFLSVHVPPLKMVVIGAVHISQALLPLARALGYAPVIIDPRTAFASAERFPDVPLYAEWPQDILPKLGLDRYTAFIALTHDPKIDDPALHLALRAGCFYIGALGSRKTHAKRVERLEAAGFSQAQIGLIKAPIGLAIGAITPAEIAISILAEMTAQLRQGGA